MCILSLLGAKKGGDQWHRFPRANISLINTGSSTSYRCLHTRLRHRKLDLGNTADYFLCVFSPVPGVVGLLTPGGFCRRDDAPSLIYTDYGVVLLY